MARSQVRSCELLLLVTDAICGRSNFPNIASISKSPGRGRAVVAAVDGAAADAFEEVSAGCAC